MKLTKEILTNSKWRVTPEQSKRLQEAAFEFGYSWPDYPVLNNLEQPYLFFEFNLIQKKDCILYSMANSESFFNMDKDTERKFEDYFEENDGFEKINDSGLYDIKFSSKENKILEFVGIKSIYEEGTFMWAVEQMKQGNKVRRKEWKHKFHIKLKGNNVCWDDKLNLELIYNINDIEATDWEIYEENKFGDFYFHNDFYLTFHYLILHYRVANPEELEDLEKAIKRAREL